MMTTVIGLTTACLTLRDKLGWSVATAAAQCGLSPEAWRRYEGPAYLRGKNVPRMLRIHRSFLDNFRQVYRREMGCDPALRVSPTTPPRVVKRKEAATGR